MADNVPFSSPTGRAAADEVTFSGQADAQVQLVRNVHVTGSEGSKTVVELAMGLGVNGTDVPRFALASDSPGITATVAHDAADSGDPIKMGGRARSSEIAAVANNDRTDFVADLTGKQIILPYANPENFVSGTTASMTGTTSTSLLAAPAAGLRNYVTSIVASNSHATVGSNVLIQDGSGGTTLLVIPAAAVYGGAIINLPVPLRQPTTATALFCQNETTGAAIKVSAVGYKGA